MDSEKTAAKTAVGFLTVLDHPQHGLFGGYLLLNLAGRPLEFHCTAPIKPNRAQQILYGPTLEAFLYGEQIGSTLLGHSKTRPLAICTDREPALALREHVDMPVALVLPPQDVSQSASDAAVDSGAARHTFRLDGAHPHHPRLISFELGRNRLALPQKTSDDQRSLSDRLGEAGRLLDLWEPFTRIREAIEEAQQAVR